MDACEFFFTFSVIGVLELCDQVRDDILPNLGVCLEDRQGNIVNCLFFQLRTASQFSFIILGCLPLCKKFLN